MFHFQITELKAQHFTLENEIRNAMKTTEKNYEAKCTNMQSKIQSLLKEVATLSKASNRAKPVKKVAESILATENSSGTDSPSAN